MIDNELAEKIRRGLAEGLRGPVTTKWLELLLQDRKERIAQDRATRAGLVEAYRHLHRALALIVREGERQKARRQ